jgi:hypothetical protein
LAPRAPRSFALFLALSVASAPLSVLAQPAQSDIAEGDKATRAKDFDGALAHYQAALKAAPSGRAQMGVADALYQLGRAGEAYEAYDETLNTYGPKLGPVEKALVAKRLKELAPKTGWLSLRVSEAGAQVDVDGKSLGLSPVPALVRVTTGPHDVHVTKAGFAPFAGHADVTADGKIVIEATLAAQSTQAHVVVHASGNEPLRVLVDGVDVGVTPWEGDLPAGTHQVAGRSSSSQAEAQTVELTAGSRTAIDLVSAATAAHIQIRTNDGKGAIFLDGVAKGEGAFSGDVAPGPHSVVVSRDGYERFEKTMTLGERQTWAETVSLVTVGAAGSASADSALRAYEGIYGGFGLFGAFGVGGMGTDLQTNCNTLGAVSCNTPSPVGGGAFGYVGWTWDPVGFELMLGGVGDTVKQTATFDAQGPSGNLPAAAPARTESFSFGRIGGLAAVRARASFQTRLLRGTVAGGVGLSYKEMFLERNATATDGSGANTKYVPNAVGYFSPAITGEAALEIRLTPTIAVSVGGLLWADNASIAGSNSSPALPPSKAQTQVLNGNPIPTPAYHFATGPQVFIGPFIGMAFGP